MKGHFLYAMMGIMWLMISLNACNDTNENTKNNSVEELLPDTHNSQNALDWAGTYEGFLPCADCEGIAVVLEINPDNTFKKSSTYKGKNNQPFEEGGIIVWDSTGNKITLKNTNGEESKYQVQENRILQLDKDGNRITGKLAENYILTKKAT